MTDIEYSNILPHASFPLSLSLSLSLSFSLHHLLSLRSPAVAPAQVRTTAVSSLEMDSSTSADVPTSVWVAYGGESIRRCPAGEPLSSPQGFLMVHPPGKAAYPHRLRLMSC